MDCSVYLVFTQGAPWLTMNDAKSPEAATEIVNGWIQRMANGK